MVACDLVRFDCSTGQSIPGTDRSANNVWGEGLDGVVQEALLLSLL